MNETQISCSDLQCAKIFPLARTQLWVYASIKAFIMFFFPNFQRLFPPVKHFYQQKHATFGSYPLILWVEKELLFKAVTTSMNLKFFNHWEFKVSVRMYSWQSLFTFLFIRLSKVLINFGYFAACSLFSSSGYLKHTSISTR